MDRSAKRASLGLLAGMAAAAFMAGYVVLGKVYVTRHMSGSGSPSVFLICRQACSFNRQPRAQQQRCVCVGALP